MIRLETYFSIGEVAKLKGVTIKALRFYDEIGLLKPSYINPETGYRYYSLEQFFNIEMIGYLKDLGVSIKCIKSLFEKNDIELFRSFFPIQRQQAITQIEHLKKIISKMEKLENQIAISQNMLLETGVYTRDLDERMVIRAACTTQPTARSTYMKYFDLYSDISRHNLSTIYETGCVVQIDPDDYSLSYKEIFVIITLAPDSLPIKTSTLPRGKYLCVNYTSATRRDKIKKIMEAIKEQGLHLQLIIEADTFVELINYCDPHMELQILCDNL